MNKKKKRYPKFQRWFKNRLLKIERRKKKKKKRGRNSSIRFGIKYTNNAIKIRFPEIIDLYNNKRGEQTLDFFNREFNDTDKYSGGAIFDFSLVKKISLSGGILIRCFYDFLQFKHTAIKCVEIKRDKIKQILCHIGLLERESSPVIYQDIDRWNIKSWNKKETTKKQFSNEIISEIIKTLTGWEEQSIKHKRLYEVIPEVLFNCIDHAYDGIDGFQWFYLFSGIANNNYVFCVLDKGIGFKATYEKRNKGYLQFDNIENDGDYIKYSIQMNSSSLGKHGRGNGLSTLEENILRLKGNIFIHSYAGKVQISPRRGEIQSENRYPLVGSLVQFSVPVSKIAD
jgi:anti-sigma regulatory factor (Ser/Thr protein kinase)